MRRMTIYCLLLLVCFAPHCDNPFNPPKGPPVVELPERATPEGVFEQLLDAYDERNIELFIDLFPKDGSFRFYVAPSFYAEFEMTHNPEDFSEARDPRLQFLEESEYYYYWTQNVEVEKHERLFRLAASIEFVDPPILGSKRKFSDGSDSLAELLVTGGRLKVGQEKGFNSIDIWIVPIEKQVFLLKKEADNLWVISKWYDFSNIVGE